MIDRRTFLKSASLASACALSSRGKTYGESAPVITKRGELHVSQTGNDRNDGTPSSMLRTISAAAGLAQPGDVVIVHQGIYRERIDPPRGGTSSVAPIIYCAGKGEDVEISGAEIIKGWKKERDDVWTVSIPNSFFGAFNPYSDLIHGDWFDPKGRNHHTGAVYLNGDWLVEAASVDEVYSKTDGSPRWFGRVDAQNTILIAQFRGVDPNEQQTEINVRQSVFYPSKPGRNYITVRGFHLCKAATPWAPPTAEQIGIIGTHWSKGWVIEENIVSYSTCSGISLGKYGDQFDNTSQDSAEGYVETIERALQNGWSRENIGHHVVRNNEVSHCEQAGIVGSLGCAFSTVTGNTVYEIHTRRLFSGAEMAGIKFHAAIDSEISNNNIYRTNRGLWLDWLAQGARVTRNTFHKNEEEDMFLEVDHGPLMVDNNLFLSNTFSLHVNSQGGAFAHNLLCGGIHLERKETRLTPFLKPHSTEIAGMHGNPTGDMRFYNNLLAERGDLSPYNISDLRNFFGGNVFLKDTRACTQEASPLLENQFDPHIQLSSQGQHMQLEITLDLVWAKESRQLVTTSLLGKALIPDLPFVRPDGAPYALDTDFSGRWRNVKNPFPGPFELSGKGSQRITVSIATLGELVERQIQRSWPQFLRYDT